MGGAGSIGERLRAAREHAFVGRSEEIAWFERLLDEGGASVVWLHAPGGTGKTALLARWSASARSNSISASRRSNSKRVSSACAAGPTMRPRQAVRTDLFLVYQLLGAALVQVGLHHLTKQLHTLEVHQLLDLTMRV